MKHYTKEELELFRHGEMSVLGKISCSSHLKECKDCEKILKELEKDDELVVELRESIKQFDELSQEQKKACW